MNIDQLAEIVCRLKDTPRTGWIRRMVENPESVAAHSWGLCLLTLILCPDDLDRLKCLEFAVVHDLAEEITGDYVPGDKITAGKIRLGNQGIRTNRRPDEMSAAA